MPSSAARTASRTAWSTESRATPGIEATGTRTFAPSTMNSGQIRSSVVSTFSRTMRRAHSDLRLRRMRVVSSSGSVRGRASTGCKRASIGRPYLIAMDVSPGAAPFNRSREAEPEARRSRSRAFHRDLSLEALAVAVDRGDRQHLAAAPVAQDAVPRGEVALDCDVVPFLGVADIIDRHV